MGMTVDVCKLLWLEQIREQRWDNNYCAKNRLGALMDNDGIERMTKQDSQERYEDLTKI